jgi:PEP-CTERM motif
MANSAKRIALTSAAATIAVFCGLGAASAYTIQIDNAVNWATEANPPPASPFTLMTIPGSGTNQLVSSSGFTSGGITVSFAGGLGATSGVYAGNISGVMSSPFGTNNASLLYLGAGGADSNGNGGGTVTVNYATAQTALDILWGTVDTDSGRNNVSITVDGVTITGSTILADVAAAGFGNFANGTANVYVEILGLGPFHTATFTDGSSNSFEFVPGAGVSGVPEPATWGMMLLGFVGLGLAFRQSRRKVSFA